MKKDRINSWKRYIKQNIRLYEGYKYLNIVENEKYFLSVNINVAQIGQLILYLCIELGQLILYLCKETYNFDKQ